MTPLEICPTIVHRGILRSNSTGTEPRQFPDRGILKCVFVGVLLGYPITCRPYGCEINVNIRFHHRLPYKTPVEVRYSLLNLVCSTLAQTFQCLVNAPQVDIFTTGCESLLDLLDEVEFIPGVAHRIKVDADVGIGTLSEG